jgi:hypothetical protein
MGPNVVIARVEGHTSPQPGAQLVFTPREGKLYFFDTASGKRLRG